MAKWPRVPGTARGSEEPKEVAACARTVSKLPFYGSTKPSADKEETKP